MVRGWQIVCALALCFLPSAAFAQTLACTQCAPVGGTFLLPTGTCTLDAAHVFSGLNCMFHTLLNDVMSRMYCGLQFRLAPLLAQAILLFILAYAIAFTVGISELTARELVTRLLKIALVWAFAMNASWGIGIGFTFFAGSIETLASAVTGNGSTAGFFVALDEFLVNQVMAPFTGQGAKVLAFFVSLWYALPPIFFLFLYLMIKVITVLIRALVSYLLGLTLIAFLIALSPIFVSFALFQVTYHFFETWLRYLISMALQVILVFAAVSVWFMVMNRYAGFFEDLGRIVISYSKVLMVGASRTVVDVFGACPVKINGLRAVCASNDVLPPTAFVQDGNLIWFLVANLITLSVVVYAFDVFIKYIPDIARQLAGPAYAPVLAGGSGRGATQLPGFSTLKRAERGVQGALQHAVGGAVGHFKEQAGKLVGGK